MQWWIMMKPCISIIHGCVITEPCLIRFWYSMIYSYKWMDITYCLTLYTTHTYIEQLQVIFWHFYPKWKMPTRLYYARFHYDCDLHSHAKVDRLPLPKMYQYIPYISHYGDVIMSAMASQMTSVLVICSTVSWKKIKDIIKVPHYWALWGESTDESTGDRRWSWGMDDLLYSTVLCGCTYLYMPYTP